MLHHCSVQCLNHYHPCSEAGIVFSSGCLCVFLSVCLSVNMITPKTVIDIITKFVGHHPIVEWVDKFKNGYIGVYRW